MGNDSIHPQFQMPKTRVIFLHIPKTAGTSFHLLLTRYFPPQDICPCRNRRLDQLTESELAQYRVFSGHYLFDQVERIPAPKTMLTFLRDPQQRLLSLYNYHRSFRSEMIPGLEAEGHDSPKYAKTLSFDEYLLCQELSVLQNVDNAMTRYLIGSRYVRRDGSLAVSDDNALNIAIENLKRFQAIGIVERASESLKRFGEVLNLSFPEELSIHNDFQSLISDPRFEAVAPFELNDSMREEIAKCIRIDQRLYDWANRAELPAMKGLTHERHAFSDAAMPASDFPENLACKAGTLA